MPRFVLFLWPSRVETSPMPRPRLLGIFGPWLAAIALWLWLFFHLHVEWSLNPQYSYGWAVPFLGIVLFYFRWQSRPEPESPIRGRVLASSYIWIVLVFLLPVRIVEQANPDWRFLSWLLALFVVDFSLLSFYRAGGRSWLKHFAFPVCFPLAAVPWPVQFENFIVQNMMRAVAFVAVEIAGWFGIGAYQIGNVIQLRNGFVGVDEACSGVKTLQAGIMVALVLGELLQLRWIHRITLVVAGCGWVFACNVFRATALVFLAANSGLEALSRWHDFIGTSALFCGMIGLLVLAWIWKGVAQPASNRQESLGRPINVGAQWAPLIWIALIFAATEAWYRAHERQLIERSPWTVNWPARVEATALPIPDSTRVILRYDDARSAAWEQPPGVRWWSFFARWNPERAALQLVRSHSPEICLPAIGRTFRAERPNVSVRVESVSLDFRSYEFEQNGRPLFVFVGIQDDKRAASGPRDMGDWSPAGRLRAAFEGKRNLGQRLLEIAVSGYDDFAQAAEALSKTAQEILRPEKSIG